MITEEVWFTGSYDVEYYHDSGFEIYENKEEKEIKRKKKHKFLLQLLDDINFSDISMKDLGFRKIILITHEKELEKLKLELNQYIPGIKEIRIKKNSYQTIEIVFDSGFILKKDLQNLREEIWQNNKRLNGNTSN